MLLILMVSFGCNETYKITYNVNGGVMPNDYQEKFDLKDNYQLPIPTKEGYFFVGWMEEGKYIDKLTAKNYNLDAYWLDANIISYKYIEDFEIYEQPETEYLVYFMRDGCSWCNKIKDDVLRYQFKTSLEQYNKNIELYVVNLRTSEKYSKILRKYEGEDGEGNNFVNKATKWDELYISATPTLIKISTNNSVRSSELIENGATKIKNKLFSYLCEEKDYSQKVIKNQIFFDLNGGTITEELVNEFYPWMMVELPTPTLEEYTFLGWFENDQLVEKLESKNYNLVAKWEKTIETKYIQKENIFLNKENNYYVLFLRHLHNIEEFIEKINQYNTYALNRGYPLIYIIDLDECKEIYRTYESSENGMYVDEATTWDELYISERYTLISLSDVNGEKQAKYIVNGVRNVPNYLKDKYGFSTK